MSLPTASAHRIEDCVFLKKKNISRTALRGHKWQEGDAWSVVFKQRHTTAKKKNVWIKKSAKWLWECFEEYTSLMKHPWFVVLMNAQFNYLRVQAIIQILFYSAKKKI